MMATAKCVAAMCYALRTSAESDREMGKGEKMTRWRSESDGDKSDDSNGKDNEVNTFMPNRVLVILYERPAMSASYEYSANESSNNLMNKSVSTVEEGLQTRGGARAKWCEGVSRIRT